MESLVITTLLLAVIGAFASYIQAISGFGFALFAIPLAIPIFGVQHGVGVITMLGFLLTAGASVKLRSQVSWKPVAMVSSFAVFGIPIGLLILVFVDPTLLTFLIGLVVLIAVVLLARGGISGLESSFGVGSAGFLSGVLLSSTGMNGAPLVAAFQSLKMSPQTFRASLQVTFTITDVFVLTGFFIVDALTWPLALMALVASPALALGWWLGDKTFKLISVKTFTTIVLLVMTASGLSAIVQAAVTFFCK